MNIAQSFVDYLQDSGIATFGQDMFIGEAPSSDTVPDSIYWIVASGGTPTTRLKSGESVKAYQVSVYYRNRNYQTIYDNMHTLEEQLNCANCVNLDGFETVDILATTFPIDNDLDVEDRKVGLLQATITVYKDCN